MKYEILSIITSKSSLISLHIFDDQRPTARLPATLTSPFSKGLVDSLTTCPGWNLAHSLKLDLTCLVLSSDWEATNEAIEEQVARESYLQWLRDNERRNKSQLERSSTVTSGISTLHLAGAEWGSELRHSNKNHLVIGLEYQTSS